MKKTINGKYLIEIDAKYSLFKFINYIKESKHFQDFRDMKEYFFKSEQQLQNFTNYCEHFYFELNLEEIDIELEYKNTQKENEFEIINIFIRKNKGE